jgi:crotonobetainyl-CoA:carnitine CoA-transferase CaiB-like acyl-CoA transferase
MKIRSPFWSAAQEVVNIIGQFFKKHSKAELLDLAIKNRFQLGPCNDAEDVLKHPQLAERNFWKEIDYPELGTSFKYPGGAVQMSDYDCGPHTRAPHIGEHNAEIYKQLRISARKMDELKAAGVI